jgi:hypothetical protein
VFRSCQRAERCNEGFSSWVDSDYLTYGPLLQEKRIAYSQIAYELESNPLDCQQSKQELEYLVKADIGSLWLSTSPCFRVRSKSNGFVQLG